MSLGADELKRLVGKTIKAVVISEDNHGNPPCQVFLVFTDDTYYEFYGRDINATHGPDSGDEDAVVEYARGFEGHVTIYR